MSIFVLGQPRVPRSAVNKAECRCKQEPSVTLSLCLLSLCQYKQLHKNVCWEITHPFYVEEKMKPVLKGASCVSFTSQSAYEGELSSSKPLISITHSKAWPEAWRTRGQPVLGAGHGRHTASLDMPGARARPHHQWKARKYSDLCLITNHLHWIFLMYVFTFKHYISFF